MQQNSVPLGIDPRFFITKTRFVLYDYSAYTGLFGEDFVEGACIAVKAQKKLAGVNNQTWLANYVARLTHLFSALKDYQVSLEFKDCSSLKLENWQAFGDWLTNRIWNEPTAPSTRKKGIQCSNKLLAILAQSGVTPVRVELDSSRILKVAKYGESKFTRKRDLSKPKINIPLSPFAFRIEAHKRVYDYTEFQPFARSFLLLALPHLAVYYKQFAAGTAKNFHKTLLNLLRFLDNTRSKGSHFEFFEQFGSEHPEQVSDIQWENLIYQWRESLNIGGTRLIGTSQIHVSNLGLLWTHLTHAQVTPSIVIFRFKNAQRTALTKPRKSLAQLTPFSKEQLGLEKAAWSRVSKYFDSTGQEEAHEFIRALCANCLPTEGETPSIEEVIDKIHALNKDRLETFRACAEADFLYWYQHWQKGQECLKAVKQSQEELTYLLDSTELAVSQRRQNSAALLFNGPLERCIGNALQYVEATQDGIATGMRGRYHHMMRSLGGHLVFHAYLHPHSHATLALWLLMLIDTGANCEVTRKTPWDCLKQTKSGFCIIRIGNKERTGGKLILDELTEEPAIGQKLSLPQAIRCYQEMASRFHRLASIKIKERLFLHAAKSIVTGLDEWTARSWFIDFLKRHEVLKDLDARPSMIRPSVLLSVQHQNSGNVAAAQIIADHTKPSTTMVHYTGRAPTILKYNLLLREFVERYQAVIIATIDGAPAKLGLSEAEFKRILSDAHRTGLGVACLDSFAGIQPGTKSGSPCTRLDACYGCQMRYVVATKENMIDLILFNRHLNEVQEQQILTNPEGWEKRWLPWLVFSDIALSKLRVGETAKEFSEAIALAVIREASYTPFPLN